MQKQNYANLTELDHLFCSCWTFLVVRLNIYDWNFSMLHYFRRQHLSAFGSTQAVVCDSISLFVNK